MVHVQLYVTACSMFRTFSARLFVSSSAVSCTKLDGGHKRADRKKQGWTSELLSHSSRNLTLHCASMSAASDDLGETGSPFDVGLFVESMLANHTVIPQHSGPILPTVSCAWYCSEYVRYV